MRWSVRTSEPATGPSSHHEPWQIEALKRDPVRREKRQSSAFLVSKRSGCGKRRGSAPRWRGKRLASNEIFLANFRPMVFCALQRFSRGYAAFCTSIDADASGFPHSRPFRSPLPFGVRRPAFFALWRFPVQIFRSCIVVWAARADSSSISGGKPPISRFSTVWARRWIVRSTGGKAVHLFGHMTSTPATAACPTAPSSPEEKPTRVDRAEPSLPILDKKRFWPWPAKSFKQPHNQRPRQPQEGGPKGHTHAAKLAIFQSGHPTRSEISVAAVASCGARLRDRFRQPPETVVQAHRSAQKSKENQMCDINA